MTLDDIIRWLLTTLFTIIFILTPDQYLSEYQQPVGRYEPGPTASSTSTTPEVKPDQPPKRVVYRPPKKRPSHNIIGKASWHSTGRDGRYAAACYDLRKAIGPDWRGRRVIVSKRRKVVEVKLNDWCGSHDKLIDLSDEVFSFFKPLSRGVIRVAVGW